MKRKKKHWLHRCLNWRTLFHIINVCRCDIGAFVISYFFNCVPIIRIYVCNLIRSKIFGSGLNPDPNCVRWISTRSLTLYTVWVYSFLLYCARLSSWCFKTLAFPLCCNCYLWSMSNSICSASKSCFIIKSTLFFILTLVNSSNGKNFVTGEMVVFIIICTAGMCLYHFVGSLKDKFFKIGKSVLCYISICPFPRITLVVMEWLSVLLVRNLL